RAGCLARPHPCQPRVARISRRVAAAYPWHKTCNFNRARYTSLRYVGLLLLAFSMLSVVSVPAAGEESGLDAELAKARAASGSEAVVAYRALAGKHPQLAVVWYELGEALYTLQSWQEALEAYQRAEKLGFKPALIQRRIGKCLEKLKRFAESEAAFRCALKADPGAVGAQFGLAVALFYQEQASAAVPLLEQLVKRQDEWGAAAREYLAQSYYDCGNYDAALALVQELLAKNPQDSAFRWLAGRTLYKLRRFDEALPIFRQVVQSDAKRAESARYYEAACLEGLGRSHEAETEYRQVSRGDSEWAKAARTEAAKLAGPALHFTLLYSGGFDTNVIQNNPDATPAGQSDSFDQVFADLQGRVLNTPDLNIWLGLEHFGLYYPKLGSNDYMQDAPMATFNIPDAGPFAAIGIRYRLNFSLLDEESYRREHHAETFANYQTKTDRLTFGLSYGDNKYYGAYSEVGGPEIGAFIDYRRQLPGWEHELRLRLNSEQRFSQLDTEQRTVQRARLQYRTRIVSAVFCELEAQYRRADYPSSQITTAGGVSAPRRSDSLWGSELQFDGQVQHHVFINWGYSFERQGSTRTFERYARHQVSAGFTLLF
ncbi:MAG: tetratricopeptide repeat protein, partial [Planctomycetota bacterium]